MISGVLSFVWTFKNIFVFYALTFEQSKLSLALGAKNAKICDDS